MEDEKLIELVHEHPPIYDIAHKKYMDTNFKMVLWNKIGEELGATGAACKTRWFNIRDNFRKSIQKNVIKISQGKKPIKPYKYHEQLKFLLKNFGDRYSIENVNVDEDGTLSDNSESLESTVESTQATSPHSEAELTSSIAFQHTSLTIPSASTSSSRERGTKRPIEEDCWRTGTSKVMEHMTRGTEHPVDMFLASLAPTLKELHPCDLFSAKSEIFSIVQKYELKLLRQKYPTQDQALVNVKEEPQF